MQEGTLVVTMNVRTNHVTARRFAKIRAQRASMRRLGGGNREWAMGTGGGEVAGLGAPGIAGLLERAGANGEGTVSVPSTPPSSGGEAGALERSDGGVRIRGVGRRMDGVRRAFWRALRFRERNRARRAVPLPGAATGHGGPCPYRAQQPGTAGGAPTGRSVEVVATHPSLASRARDGARVRYDRRRGDGWWRRALGRCCGSAWCSPRRLHHGTL